MSGEAGYGYPTRPGPQELFGHPLAEPAVGGWAFLPEPYGTHVPDITNKPGQVVSIEGDWAMVDRGSWGQFGCAVADLLWTEAPDSAAETYQV